MVAIHHSFERWFPRPDCVVICGGKGSRLNPRFSELAKSMVPVSGVPLIRFIVDAWRPAVGRFVFVLNHFAEQIERYVQTLGIPHALLRETGAGKGIANALLYAAPEIRTERFIMVLGDCLHRGIWSVPGDMAQGVGVVRTGNADDIQRSYSVELEGSDRIARLVEKPKILVNDLCGTGFYFLERGIFEHIRSTPCSPLRGQIEITDVLQRSVDRGTALSAVMLEGYYLNLTFPTDLPRAEEILRAGPPGLRSPEDQGHPRV